MAWIMAINGRIHAGERYLIMPTAIKSNLGDPGSSDPSRALINAINQNGLTNDYVDGRTKFGELVNIFHFGGTPVNADGATLNNPNINNNIFSDFIITIPRETTVDGIVIWSASSFNSLQNTRIYCSSEPNAANIYDPNNSVWKNTQNPTSTTPYIFPRLAPKGEPQPAQFLAFDIPQKARFILLRVTQRSFGSTYIGEIAFTSSTPNYAIWKSQLKLPDSSNGFSDEEGDGIPDGVNWAFGDGTLLPQSALPGPPNKNSLLWSGQVDPGSPNRIPNPTISVTSQTTNGLFSPIPPPTWSSTENTAGAGPILTTGRSLQDSILKVHYSQIREFRSTEITYTSRRKTTKTTVIRLEDRWFDSFTWPSTKLKLQGPNWNSWTLNLPEAGTRLEIHLESRGSSGAWTDFLTLPAGSKNLQSGVPRTGILLNGHTQVRARIVAPNTDFNNLDAFVVRAPILDNLSISSGTLSPIFTKTQTSYTASVTSDVSSLTLIPTTADTTATVNVQGNPVASGMASPAIPLSVGSNIITVLVTAQDPTMTKAYTVNVTRAAPSIVATLNGLNLSSGTLSPAFAASTLAYTASVAADVESIIVTPTLTGSNATVKVEGQLVTSGSASSPISLAVGSKTIVVQVTALDDSVTTNYTVQLTRPGSYASWAKDNFTAAQLENQSISGMNQSPAGDGVSNLMKYALAIPPMSPAVLPEMSQSNGYLTLKYRRNNQSPDLTFTVEASNSLIAEQWEAVTTHAPGSPSPNQGLFHEETIQDSVPITGSPNRFMRLKVTK